MTTLFEFTDALMVKGVDLTEDLTFEKDYAPFIINRAVAQNQDTLIYAEAMNKIPWVAKELQYKFYLKGIPKKKRYGKWSKKETNPSQEDIDNIIEVYQVSLEKALEYLEVLNREQLDALAKQTFKGGRK